MAGVGYLDNRIARNPAGHAVQRTLTIDNGDSIAFSANYERTQENQHKDPMDSRHPNGRLSRKLLC